MSRQFYCVIRSIICPCDPTRRGFVRAARPRSTGSGQKPSVVAAWLNTLGFTGSGATPNGYIEGAFDSPNFRFSYSMAGSGWESFVHPPDHLYSANVRFFPFRGLQTLILRFFPPCNLF